MLSTLIPQLLNEVHSLAEQRNHEVFRRAFDLQEAGVGCTLGAGGLCLKCNYSPTWDQMLPGYTYDKQNLHRKKKALERLYDARWERDRLSNGPPNYGAPPWTGSIKIINLECEISKLESQIKRTKKFMDKFRPCPDCFRRFNPTNRKGLPKNYTKRPYHEYNNVLYKPVYDYDDIPAEPKLPTTYDRFKALYINHDWDVENAE